MPLNAENDHIEDAEKDAILERFVLEFDEV